MEVFEHMIIYGGSHIVSIKAKKDNKTKYFEVRLDISSGEISLSGIGVANDKRLNYKYLSQLDSKYRGLTGEAFKIKFYNDLLQISSYDILKLAMDTVKNKINYDKSLSILNSIIEGE